ncbi:TetR/AcrR family transcriptional regulator [Sphingomonas sp. ERG5]|uniref:TetR/AcrR family transcriptional regulator n=1 Tax=Sphingomonas sp. ERG5 TaxID=1381597 RepID=UPI00190F8020|nr:TetR/AcrR family transcriptional regulator [Sphingomonas sp. ERG5]
MPRLPPVIKATFPSRFSIADSFSVLIDTIFLQWLATARQPIIVSNGTEKSLTMEKRGRPRTFDRDAALQRAMELFWENGFEETSMTDLTDAMGIASPSLYAAFGSKEALFREAVERYQGNVGTEIWDALDSEPEIAAAIGAFLMNTARSYSDETTPRGCMIVLGARSMGQSSHPVCEMLKAHREMNLVRLRQRFDRAVADGQLPATFDCAAAAAFYAALQHGMSIIARDGADAATLEAIAITGRQSFASPAGAGVR